MYRISWSIASQERKYINKPKKPSLALFAEANEKLIYCTRKRTLKLQAGYLEDLTRTVKVHPAADKGATTKLSKLISCREKQIWIKTSERASARGNQHEPGMLWVLLESPSPGSGQGQGDIFPVSQLISFCQQFRNSCEKLLNYYNNILNVFFLPVFASRIQWEELLDLQTSHAPRHSEVRGFSFSVQSTMNLPGGWRSAWLPFLELLRAILRYVGSDNDILRAAKKSADRNAQTSSARNIP